MAPWLPLAMPPQSVAIFRCAENTLRARVRVCLGGSRAEKEAPGGGGNGTGAPTAPAPQDSPLPNPSPRRPQPVLFGDVSSPPPTPFTSAPPFIRPLPACTRHTLSPRPGAPLPPTKPAPASLPRTAPRSPPRARGLLRVILRSKRRLLRFLPPLRVALPSSL